MYLQFNSSACTFTPFLFPFKTKLLLIFFNFNSYSYKKKQFLKVFSNGKSSCIAHNKAIFWRFSFTLYFSHATEFFAMTVIYIVFHVIVLWNWKILYENKLVNYLWYSSMKLSLVVEDIDDALRGGWGIGRWERCYVYYDHSVDTLLRLDLLWK